MKKVKTIKNVSQLVCGCSLYTELSAGFETKVYKRCIVHKIIDENLKLQNLVGLLTKQRDEFRERLLRLATKKRLAKK
jgi:hypothetical protein